MVRIISCHDLDGYQFDSDDLRVDGIVFEREPYLVPTKRESKPHVPIAPLPTMDLSSLGVSLTGGKTCKRHLAKNESS